MSESKPSPNDQRSNTKNPNNAAHDADAANREAQRQQNAPTPPQQPKSDPTKR